MKRLLLSTSLTAAALLLAACGSDGTASSSPTGAPTGQTGAPAGAQTNTVAVMSVGGMGDVLVDSAGKALYTPDEESGGVVHCTGDCLSIWAPLTLKSGTPTGPAGGPALAVLDRPDGPKQVTAAGRPLYTFSFDAAGQVTGDGVTDSFGSEHFTWHVVHADGTAGGTAGSTPAATTPSTGAGGGYGGY